MTLFIVRETYQVDRGNGDIGEIDEFRGYDTEQKAREHAEDCAENSSTIGIEIRTVEWDACQRVAMRK